MLFNNLFNNLKSLVFHFIYSKVFSIPMKLSTAACYKNEKLNSEKSLLNTERIYRKIHLATIDIFMFIYIYIYKYYGIVSIKCRPEDVK